MITIRVSIILVVFSGLFVFNVGVEVGQLLFVSVVFGLLTAWRRLPLPASVAARRLFPYAVGSIAAFWMIERIAVAFSSSV